MGKAASESPHRMITSSSLTRSSTDHNPKYHHILHREQHHITNPSHSRLHSRNNDKLQRKQPKMGQEILSKNIQHDILTNKEEMMATRSKTRDVRIENLQNDINKLRDQLSSKNEAMDNLINETNELQQQNRGLSTKLRESNITINDEEHSYNESMRDILKHLEQKLYDITNDINDIKQNQKQQNHGNEMKEREKEFMENLQREQSEWINSSRPQIQENHEILESKYKAFESLGDKLEEWNKGNLTNLNHIFKKEEHREFFQSFFDENKKEMVQSQQLFINELKQEIKREISAIKNDSTSTIKKTKNEIDSNIHQIAQNMTNFKNDLKFEIKNASFQKNKENVNNLNHLNMNNEIMEKYQRSIQSQTDIMNQNALKLQNVQQSLNDLSKENESIHQMIDQQTNFLKNTFKAISDETQTKTSQTIKRLQPLFAKLYKHFNKNVLTFYVCPLKNGFNGYHIGK